MVVRVTSQYRTVREKREDATSCAECGAVDRTFYDYETVALKRPPAFCNKECWIGYKLKAGLRAVTSMEEAPSARKPNENKRKPRKRQPPGKTKPAQPKGRKSSRHLVAV